MCFVPYCLSSSHLAFSFWLVRLSLRFWLFLLSDLAFNFGSILVFFYFLWHFDTCRGGTFTWWPWCFGSLSSVHFAFSHSLVIISQPPLYWSPLSFSPSSWLHPGLMAGIWFSEKAQRPLSTSHYFSSDVLSFKFMPLKTANWIVHIT